MRRLSDDVFRWKCQAILEGLIEGATLDETKTALWDFVWSHAHGVEDWSKVPRDDALYWRAEKELQDAGVHERSAQRQSKEP